MIWTKKFLCVCIIVLSAFSSAQEQLMPEVDERVELVSIVFRLAGAEEYNRNYNKKYAEDIAAYFEPYKNAEIVNFVQENRNKYGLGYDAVMSMALHLSFKNKKFSFTKEKESTLEKRWEKVEVKKFVSLLNEFYKNSDFQKFFDNHSASYAKAVQAYGQSILKDFNQNWYPHFYGKAPNEEYRIILGYGNGGGNYGITLHPEHHKTIVYAVVGVSDFDSDGNAIFDKNEFQPLLIHEFNHSFVNYILEMKNYKSELKAPAEKIYSLVEKEMKSQAYGDWETMINESLVRAAVIRYMIDNHYPQSTIDEEIQMQRGRKFLWIKELTELLGKYEESRNRFPVLEDFYPEIIAFYKNLEPKLQGIIDNQPKVVSVSPDIMDKNDVDSKITEIIITFSKEMLGKGVSINLGESGKEHFPLKKFEGYLNNNTAIKIQTEMKPDTEYEFVLTGNKFISKDGYPLQRTSIKFKTK
ncbi:DUF4932 domain-containing protein [uncultured Chryseobacterium sp.]|uniref:DUF4932 domain-containing protein n=1 Tax=uncultured Chryseobacterium sp. TaxID=259322 RepID=UPI0025D2E3A2|nr:DUF4932 domain-containing protein [uncultured Chryseobacterium sp.]